MTDDAPDPRISELRFSAYVHGPTASSRAQRAILGALASDESTAPTHGGLDDRRREPFDLDALAHAAGTPPASSPFVWRLHPPKLWGLVDATPYPVGRVILHYEDIEDAAIPTVCKSLVRLVDRLQPAYALLHFAWAEPNAAQLASLRGSSTKEIHYCKYGPPGVFAWTWFGPALREQLGLAALLAQGGLPTGWGGVSLPLVDEPWTVRFETLHARQLVVDAALRSRGYFGDYSAALPRPGEHWTPPPDTPEPTRG